MIWYTKIQVVHNSYQVDVSTLLKQIRMTLKTHKANLGESSSYVETTSLWFLKVNFNVAVKPKFSITSAVIGDEYGKVIAASSLKLNSSKVNVRGPKASLLATNLALSNESKSLILEGVPQLLSWLLIGLISSQIGKLLQSLEIFIKNLALFPNWEASKAQRQTNLQAHLIAKWAASHNFFRYIPCNSPLFSVLSSGFLYRSGKEKKKGEEEVANLCSRVGTSPTSAECLSASLSST